ncbi:cadherin-99C-like isoform X2 [Varroa jacobsoni]|uniref:cadherin-99C-like isoform X2 n=1 Tax=Varroa jacobsoni TaxID=62625 RepID=UPI000BFA11CD|nr:cadherin-99C-like isoform X2 [Varroa jacobsoni]
MMCDIHDNEKVIIMDILESQGQQFNQKTSPVYLPIEGKGDEIEISVISSSKDAFAVLGEQLVLQKPLDRDAEDLSSVRVQLRCAAKNGSRKKVIQVLVRVNDINDNAPVFSSKNYTTSVSEEAPVGTMVFANFTATDLDAGVNGLVEYFVEGTEKGDEADSNDAAHFFSVDSPHQGIVTIKRPLDYERAQVYYLRVIAVDKAVNIEDRQTSTTTLTINIEDADDLPPMFFYPGCTAHNLNGVCEGVQYRGEVASGAIEGALKLRPDTIYARDQDSMDHPIQYSFVDGTPSDFRSIFEINITTGIVSQIAPASRAVTTHYSITVKAEEQSEYRRFALASLTVEVLVADLHPPVLSANVFEGYVDETSPVGTRVMSSPRGGDPIMFQVTDEDYSEKEQYYSFAVSTIVFKVDAEGFLVVGEPQLDRDSPNPNVYEFEVQAKEVGTPEGRGLSRPIQLRVHLNDVNDNSPVLPLINPVTLESGDGIRTVMKVEASDNDEGDNARVAYSIYHISNNGAERFAIDPETGELRVMTPVDAGEQFSITVQATDGGGLYTQGIIEVMVIPGPNLGGPIFTQDEYYAEVAEGSPVGVPVTTVKASDPERGVVYYSIVDGNFGGSFSVDQETGTVFVVGRLDRESKDSYNLTLKASDSGDLYNVASLLVNIADINDEVPQFTESIYKFVVPEGVSAALVGQVNATDRDTGVNAEIKYSMEDPTLTFSINEVNGSIYNNRPLNFETEKDFVMVVTATDRGENMLSAKVEVRVRVQDEQDEVPIFEKNFYEVDIKENMPNTSLIKIEAVDPDTEKQITYVIKEGDRRLFSINSVTGMISTLKGLDFEIASLHTLVVGTLENQNENDPKSTATIKVIVVDVNDNAPKFVTPPLPTRLQDSAPVGTMVATMVANDEDGTVPLNVVKYELIGQGRALNFFTIDSNSGMVTVKDDLKKEPTSEYTIDVKAYDQGEPSLSTSLSFIVYVEHLATVQPDSGIGFVDGHFQVELDENVAEHTLLKAIPVVNRPPRAHIDCHISSGNERGHFYAKMSSQGECEVRVAQQVRLDYENLQQYQLAVRLAASAGVFSASRLTAQLTVDIRDVNDNRPVFIVPPGIADLSGNSYLGALPIDSPVGYEILTVTAEDMDSEGNGRVSFEIVPETNKGEFFTINPNSGMISSIRAFDEAQNHSMPIKLKIVARDNPVDPGATLSQRVNVYINLLTRDNQLCLVMPDMSQEKVRKMKDRLASIIKKQSHMLVGVHLIGPMEFVRNNTVEHDGSGTDLWFHLIDPQTLKAVSVKDRRIRSLVAKGDLQATAMWGQFYHDVGINVKAVRQQIVVLPPTTTETPEIIEIRGAKRSMVFLREMSDLGAVLIGVGVLIFIFGIFGIVYHCCAWKRFLKQQELAAQAAAIPPKPKLFPVPPVPQSPRYEPVYAESSMKEYETQVLQMSVNIDDGPGGTVRGLPFTNPNEVTYMSRSQLDLSPCTAQSKASTQRLSSEEGSPHVVTKNPLYEAISDDDFDDSQAKRRPPK